MSCKPDPDNTAIPLVPPTWHRFLHFFELKILTTGYKQPYRPSLLFQIPPHFTFHQAFDPFYEFYLSNKTHHAYSFTNSLILWLTPQWALQSLAFTLEQLLSISYALILKQFTQVFSQPTLSPHIVGRYAALFSLISLFRALVKIHGDTPLIANTTNCENAIYGIYFKKLETIDLQSIKRIDIGAIKSALTSDLLRITRAISTSHQLLSTPITLLVSLILIVRQTGRYGAIGFFIFLALSLSQHLMTKKTFTLWAAKLAIAETRHKTVANIVTGIRTIKFNAWEDVMLAILDRARVREKALTTTIILVRNALDGFFYLLPCLCTFLFLLTLPASHSIPQTLNVVGLLSLLIGPLRNLIFALVSLSEAAAALQRLARFLDLPDQPEHLSIEVNHPELLPGEMLVTALTAAFDPPTPALRNLTLRLNPGEFVGVIGKIGSGKTALIKSLMRMLPLLDGSIRKNGKIAYISQESFLIHGTLRENITFGLELDHRRYRRVLRICELAEDLNALPAGDQTEVGERGVALSGGQKQRISIARALYSHSDIYLIDDCLSALDNQVAHSIFRNAFRGYLRGKTILMVTHALHFLKKLDRVLIIDAGAVVAQGSYRQLLGNPRFDAFVSQVTEQRVSTLTDLEEPRHHDFLPSVPELPQEASPQDAPPPALRQEARFHGIVPWPVYRHILVLCGKSNFWLNFFLMALTIAIKILTEQWITAYKASQSTDNPMSPFALKAGYATFLLFFAAAIALRSFFFSRYASEIGYRLFSRLMQRLVRKRMSYFDTTPLGQIINLTSKDIDLLDVYIPMMLMFAIIQLFQLAEMLLQTLIANPLTLPLFALFIALFLALLYVFLRGAIEIMRLQQIAVSPVLSNIIEMYNGLPLFRAYLKTDFQKQKYARHVDHLISIKLHEKYLSYFVIFAVELLSGLAVSAIILVLGIYRGRRPAISEKDLTRTAIAIVGIIRIPSLLTSLFYAISEAAQNMSSAERVLHNVDDTETEPSWDAPSAPPDWPTNGHIHAQNIVARYRPGLPLVLRGIDFSIAAGEKIGVVGRTGCGKSSLLLALTRIVSIEEDQNPTILIDGLDAHEIGVRVLRRAIKVIPQDPFCFKGTLRENVDPQGAYSDAQVAEALSKSQFWEAKKPHHPSPTAAQDTVVLAIDAQRLDAPIEEGGKNLSAGEKQLVCIARVILAHPKILLMDEATSSIDHHTDLVVQKVIKQEFQHSTVITVAHRLNTIIHYDRLLVLDKGKLVEAGTPLELLSNDTVFRAIVRENGPEFEKKMLRLALNRDLDIEEEFPDEPSP